MNRKVLLALSVLVLVLGFIVAQPFLFEDKGVGASGRWYTERQVAEGGPLFQTHCASCHGPEAASIPNWRETDENGNYPPPPLDGSAHAWHHPLSLLQKTVRDGGVPLGGQMPPFKDVLSAEEIDFILAWIQTHWSDKVYGIWEERNG